MKKNVILVLVLFMCSMTLKADQNIVQTPYWVEKMQQIKCVTPAAEDKTDLSLMDLIEQKKSQKDQSIELKWTHLSIVKSLFLKVENISTITVEPVGLWEISDFPHFHRPSLLNCSG